jgi:hypothetical protein
VHSGIYTVHSPTNALLFNLEEFKMYIKIHINIAATCFGLRPSSGSFSQDQYKLPEDGRRPKHVGAIFMCILM